MRTSFIFRTFVVVASVAPAACTQDRVMDEVTETTIGPTGGVATSFDGLAVADFPEGAVSESVGVTISTVAPPPGLLSAIYVLGPSTAELREPVELRIRTEVFGPKVLVRLRGDGSQNPLPSWPLSEDDLVVVGLIEALGTYAVARGPGTAGDDGGSGSAHADASVFDTGAPGTTPDAGRASAQDASVFDAGATDGGSTGSDAQVIGNDAQVIGNDAQVIGIDAQVIGNDASIPGLDAGTASGPDAGASCTILTRALPTGMVRTPYSALLSAGGCPSPTWTVTNGALPIGIGLVSTSGELFGRPLAPFNRTITFTASQPGFASDTAAVSLQIQ